MRDETKWLTMISGNHQRYCGKQIGCYKIIRRIGEGRYGVCFLAEAHGRQLIIKKLKPALWKRNSAKNAMEIQILSGLCHPGIPKLLGIVDEKGFYGPVLEFKYGETIETMLFKQKHCFSNFEILSIGGQLIEIIKYLHGKGIVHRDIRIPNVLVDGGAVTLVDFGLARWEDHERYTRDIDFAFLGDLLLYLLYSSYQKENRKNRPWYEELPLSPAQREFLKRLFKLAPPYQDIDEVAGDFQTAFAGDGVVL